MPMATPTVDLTAINPATEIVLRAGDAKHPQAKATLHNAYGLDKAYPDVIGISVLFKIGASLDDLMREGHFRHSKVSYAPVGRIVSELASVGYELVLYVTPDLARGLPDHHTLAVARAGAVLQALPDDGADALLRVLTVRDNLYQSKP
jgi:hypothetical protein